MENPISDYATSPNLGSHPGFRSRLKVGMVLMTDDCHVFAIDEIRSEGVISREWTDPHHLWTWNDLRDCMIYGESREEAGVAGGTVMQERGGLIDLSAPAPIREWVGLVDGIGYDSHEPLDQAMGAELARLLPPGLSEITLRVTLVKLEGNRGRLDLLLDDGKHSIATSDDRLLHAATCQYRFAAVRQPRPWSGMTFMLRSEEGGWRFHAAFEHA